MFCYGIKIYETVLLFIIFNFFNMISNKMLNILTYYGINIYNIYTITHIIVYIFD